MFILGGSCLYMGDFPEKKSTLSHETSENVCIGQSSLASFNGYEYVADNYPHHKK